MDNKQSPQHQHLPSSTATATAAAAAHHLHHNILHHNHHSHQNHHHHHHHHHRRSASAANVPLAANSNMASGATLANLSQSAQVLSLALMGPLVAPAPAQLTTQPPPPPPSPPPLLSARHLLANQPAPVYHLKILVPAAAAGRIIGKGGTTIAQLQKDAGARVKMSKASEFYPGTTERVCLISGPIEGILKINDFFMENFSSTSIKILVPNSTAGMIIGKGGSYIKQIKEDSGAYVQISQKCTDLSLPERCVTIIGELKNIRKACVMILSKIVEDVGSAYRDIRTPSITANILATFSSPSSPSLLANNNLINNHSNNNNNHSHINLTTAASAAVVVGASSLSSSAANNINNSIINNLNNNNNPGISSNTNSTIQASNNALIHHNNNINSHTHQNQNQNQLTSHLIKSLSPDHLSCQARAAGSPPSVTTGAPSDTQIIESIKLVLRVSGYGEDAVSEITSAMSTLASYGVLGVGLGLI